MGEDQPDREKHGAPARCFASAGAPVDRLERLTAIDHPDRSSPFPTRPRPPVFLRVDLTHELPIVALDEGGREIMRFRHLAAAAWCLADDGSPVTLPYPIVIAARREDPDQLALDIGGAP